MTVTLAVPKQAGAVRQEWLRLAAAAAATEKFDPAMTAELPAAVQRWLGHAILPGTPLWRSVELTMHGQIKLGRWRPFTARQALAPPRRLLLGAPRPPGRPAGDRLRPAEFRHRADALAATGGDPHDDRGR